LCSDVVVDAAELALVALAALLAGAVNAVAGGGSLVLFPALLATGLPALAANVTNTVALWPGYLGTVTGYRAELRGQARRAAACSASVGVGAAVGAALLLTTPEDVFDAVVPFLVVAASLLLALQAPVGRLVHRLPGSGGGARSPLLHVGLVLAGVYGGYFGGGLGVVLLAVLAVLLADDLQRLNGLRSMLSLAVNTVALVAFVALGPVSWPAVAVAAPASLLGGYAGARAARRLPAVGLRALVVAFGLAVGIALALR
jgi:uncharacterized membrane protein YfcA